MRNGNTNNIGIKQIIRLNWMDYVLSALQHDKNPEEIRNELNVLVSIRQDSDDVIEKGNETKKFLVRNLMKSWVEVTPSSISIRDRLTKIAVSSSIPLHWVSISVAYPFWFDVATIVGRLLNLQQSFNHHQLLIRLKEKYGDRETVKRCTRYVLRSMHDWGVVTEINRKTGQYGPAEPIAVNDPILITLFLEMVLTNFEREQITFSEFKNHPSLFPFKFKTLSSSEIAAKSGNDLSLVRQINHDEVFTLR